MQQEATSNMLHMFGVFFEMFLFLGTIILFSVILPLYFSSKVMEKMRLSRWKGWVPIYNVYTIWSYVWKKRYFFLCILTFIGAIIVGNEKFPSFSFNIPLRLFFIVYALILIIMYYSKYAEAFGYSRIVSILGLLAPPVFDLIIGLGPYKCQVAERRELILQEIEMKNSNLTPLQREYLRYRSE